MVILAFSDLYYFFRGYYRIQSSLSSKTLLTMTGNKHIFRSHEIRYRQSSFHCMTLNRTTVGIIYVPFRQKCTLYTVLMWQAKFQTEGHCYCSVLFYRPDLLHHEVTSGQCWIGQGVTLFQCINRTADVTFIPSDLVPTRPGCLG